MKASKNIFSTLAKYNPEEENYLTEAFVFLLNLLLHRERSVALEILTKLCDSSFAFDELIDVSTQHSTDQGTPDIKVSSSDKRIYIEVKVDSPLGYQQLERYRAELDCHPEETKRLVLLTLLPEDLSGHHGVVDKHIYWIELYDWLSKIIVHDSIDLYLLESLRDFLKEKGMGVEKVEIDYINGMVSFNSLINMIQAAIKNAKIEFYKGYPRAAAWNSKGFWLEEKEYWCGIHYNKPTVITFEIGDKTKFDLSRSPNASSTWWPGKQRLWRRLPLEDILFFSLDKDKQLEEITKFIKTAYAEAQQMMVK